MSQPLQLKSELVCRQCGQPEAHAVGDEILCAACCHERGSCCHERGISDSGDLPVAPVIRIAAALLCRADGRTLLVRKRGTTAFMQPGGKIERGEAPLAALARELHEELGLTLDPATTVPLGRFTAPAAHEAGHLVEAEIFRVDITADVRPAAEIEEIVWIEPAAPGSLPLAPLTRDFVLPLHAADGKPFGPE